MRTKIGFAILAVVALSRSCAIGQGVAPTDWLGDLAKNINALNRNIQQNVGQLNERIRETVNTETARIHRLTDNLNEGLVPGTVQVVGGGGNVVLSDDQGTRLVKSGQTSDGKQYVYESSSSIIGDTLRNMITIRYPALNVSRVYGYTLNLQDVQSKPVPIEGSNL